MNAKRIGIGLVLALTCVTGIRSARSEVILEYSFDASAPIPPMKTTYDLPGPGRFRVTALNPDLSLDGRAYVEATQGGTRRYYMDGIFFGYTDVPAFFGQATEGVGTRVYEFDAPQSIVDLGPLDYRLSYNVNGTENTGNNTVRLEYFPLNIEASGPPLLTITSPPGSTGCEPQAGTFAFDAGVGGTLVLRKTSIGNGGGGIEVYVDSLGYGFTHHLGTPTPAFYTVEVGPGTHDLKICHNDTFFGDNSGTRTEEVYFLPSTSIPTVSEWGLVAMTLFLILAASRLIYARRGLVRA